MKTLDEVIRSLETVDNTWHNARHFMNYEDFRDGLHYLRQYQKDKQIYSYDIARRNLEVAERNDPLSWDELKQMEGKPVFVEERYRNGDLKSSGWWLIDFWNDDQICLRDQGGNSWNEHRSNYGRDWQAYRKEKKCQ